MAEKIVVNGALTPEPAISAFQRREAFWVLGLMILTTALIYGGTLQHPLVFDDDTYLRSNPYFTGESFGYLANYTDFIRSPLKRGFDPDLTVNFVLRPFAYATFYANWLMEGFQPRGYRLVNIFIHLVGSIALWALLRRLLRGAGEVTSRWVSLLTTSAFLLHPLGVESVTYIVQRFTSMACTLGLISLCLHFKALESSRRPMWQALSVLALLFAMLTKECSIVFPLLALGLDVLVIGTAPRAALRRSLPLLLLLPLIPAQVILASSTLNDGLAAVGPLHIVNSRDAPIPHAHYLFTQFIVIADYLRMVIWPSGLNIDPEWQLRERFADPGVLAALALHVLILAAAVWGYRRWRSDVRARLALVGLLWFYGAVFISSGLVPLPDLAADHRAYFPAIGVLITLACIIDVVRARLSALKASWLLPALAAGACIALGTTTWLRNDVWGSAERLWSDAAAKSPGKFRVWSNLGAVLSDNGRDDAAVPCFRKSVELEPRFVAGALNLSNSLLRLNRPQESIESLLKLIEADASAARHPGILYTLAHGLTSASRHAEAAIEIQKVVQLQPEDGAVHVLHGVILARCNQGLSALRAFREAYRLAPDNPRLPDIIARLEAELRKAGVSY